ncbi:hypothetical protein VTK26DRAFT_3031 [Humicola hyalothermophila]
MSQRPGTHVPAVRAETEKALGITQRSAPFNFAWTGDIRKRYTDFLVYEIRRDGHVLHLRDFEEDEQATQTQDPNGRRTNFNRLDSKPSVASLNKQDNKPNIVPISEDDRNALVGLIGESTAHKLIKLHENILAKVQLEPKDRTVVFDPITDRSQRAIVHQEIRRIFNSRFETAADAFGVITATPARWGQNNRGGNNGGRRDNNRPRDHAREFKELGEYLHFTLYKENKDTMDAINTIARLLKVKASTFGFAGTKDRRAATVQRISVYRQKPSNLTWLNSRIANVKVGQFEFAKEPLQLGQHGGNEFIITLKNCQPLGGADCSLAQRMKMIQQAVECGLAYLKHNGYINYFGLQRFGTHSIGTHSLGMKILQGNYEGFIDDVLHVDDELIHEVFNAPSYSYGGSKDSQNSREEQDRARAITAWKATKNADKALQILPKRFSSESAIIRHLGKTPRDFTGAVLSITRGMRMMYIHAYQSYVWNYVATRRWSKYGPKVIEGDLVLITGARRQDTPDDVYNPYDDCDEDDLFAQARVLTAADVASGKYTIFDIVLPTPGYDVLYPRNDIGEYYVEFMGKPENGALNPYEMRRKQREFSLSGSYRHLVGRFIGEPQYAIRAYCDDTEQMYPTDLDFALHKKTMGKREKAAEQRRKALTRSETQSIINSWLHFANNPSAYDSAVAAERRRKADQEPASDGVNASNETWVQTGVDGSDKRVKLARHHQQIDHQLNNDPSLAQGASTMPKLSISQFDGASAPHDDSDDDSYVPGPGSGGVPLFSPKKEEDPLAPRVVMEGGIPMVTVPDSAIPTTGIRGVSDTYYASTGQVPYFGMPRPDLNAHAAENGGAVSQQHLGNLGPATKSGPSGSSDKLGWYGAKLPDTSAARAEPKANDLANDTVGPEEASEAEMINGVPLPKFRTASSNPLSSSSSHIDEASLDPAADKIAVILKFQLKQSNYATIVLRELMGAPAEGAL